MNLSATRPFFLLGLALVFVVCLTGPAGAASNAPISELVLLQPRVSATAERVTFAYGVKVKGLVPLRDQLRDGAQMKLEGSLTLLQHNLLRPNSQLATVPLAWNLRFDLLTREFMVTGEDGTVRSGPFIDELLRNVWQQLRVELSPEDPLETDQTYIVQLSLILRYDEAPPWLRNALFFWSRDLSPTLEYEQRFSLQ